MPQNDDAGGKSPGIHGFAPWQVTTPVGFAIRSIVTDSGASGIGVWASAQRSMSVAALANCRPARDYGEPRQSSCLHYRSRASGASTHKARSWTVKVRLQAIVTGLIGIVAFGLLLFLPAGTFDYWQAWVFIAVFTLSTSAATGYLMLKNPAALQRRMRGGPVAETRAVQRILVSVLLLLLPAVMVFSAFDHRFGWSPVPTLVSVAGDALVLTGLSLAMLVVVQNSYAAANVSVQAGQQLTTTGLYGFVRHPMYIGTLIMMIGLPLALDSWWGLVVVIPGLSVLILRILDEERMLEEELEGYREYKQKVQYRLVPHVW
jgi:protein-S-isoprenylcysteine O-methyltransferase Ste14